MSYRLFGILLLFMSFHFNVYSQKATELSDKQIQELINQIEAKGLSEAEVELMAKARGYTDEDIAIIKERINRKQSGTDSKTPTEKNETAREQLGEVSQRVKLQDQSVNETAKRIFGRDIFNNSKITFEPNLRLPTPPDYILGVDDEISIDISGYAVQNYQRKISPEGIIRIEHFAPIYLNGLTIDQAKEKIKNAIVPGYAGLKTGGLRLDLTLVNVKTIKVTLMGEVASAGTYSVSSFATIFNALYLSGGPNQIGSFRNIQLLRNNKVVHTLDIYDFLTTGSLKDNVNLREGDVIFVPVASTLVELTGEVKRPFQFELKPGESFTQLLNFAGGFTDKAYSKQVKIERTTGEEKEILNLQEIRYPDFIFKNGDKVEVGAILDRYSNRVEVQGAVFRPGFYELGSNSTVAELISNAEGLREDAFRSRALIRRLNDKLDPELIPVNLDSVRLGFDIPLRREDILIVKSITETRELRSVTIGGSINIPGEYDFSDKMTLNDLILMAGGLNVGASLSRVEIARRINNPQDLERRIRIIYVDINKNLNNTDGDFELKPFDKVLVRSLPGYEKQRMVSIEGQVLYPGQFSIESQDERISDLIDRAGGLMPDAYIEGAKFFRDGHQVAIDLKKIMSNKDKAFNLFLLEGDRLFIPIEDQTVTIRGEVLNPTTLAYQQNFSFKDYIAQAGGYTDSASVGKSFVRYSNGHMNATRSFLGIKSHPSPERGMEIFVPKRKKTAWTPAEKVTVLTSLTSLTTILITLLRFSK